MYNLDDFALNDLFKKYDGLEVVEYCPHCDVTISPILISQHKFYDESLNLPMHTLVLQCNRHNCSRLYLADIWLQSGFASEDVTVIDYSILPKVTKVYDDDKISDISPEFVNIYNESLKAEGIGLLKICGCGYRKAIEFLVKDYIISSNKDNEDFNINDIKKSTRVIKLIEKYFEDPLLISVAKKLFWLGNDETHYERKWESKDIKDMKNLIEVFLYKIKMDLSVKKYNNEMGI